MLLAESLLGTSSVAANFIEDVFSTYLYTGNSSTQTITNGIDLSGKGGLVWLKYRSGGGNPAGHFLYTPALVGSGNPYYYKHLQTNNTNAAGEGANDLTAFNSTGFSLGGNTEINYSGDNYVSWTFRKQPKFFDVVTYTGNGTSGRQIAHSLGSTPGCIIVKSTSNATAWAVYHRSLNIAGGHALRLNTMDASVSLPTFFNSTVASDTTFTVGDAQATNQNTLTYVAFLFAHDAGGFGATGADNVISCGSFTSNSSDIATITLGYEPQFVLMKSTSTTGGWWIADNMRGFTVSGEEYLQANSTGAEASGTNIRLTNTGFTQNSTTGAATTYIYIAIRRGPMKTPTSGTSVFSPVARTGTGTTATVTTNFPVDLIMTMYRSGGLSSGVWDRLRGIGPYLETTGIQAEATATNSISSLPNTAYVLGTDSSTDRINRSGYTYANWVFSRAPGFFDVVCYTGDSTLGRAVPHNLGAVPELMIVKNRNNTENWVVYSAAVGASKRLILNSTAGAGVRAVWADTTPTSTNFYVGGSGVLGETNYTTYTYVAYLFATVAGVSKVGSYTGSGTTKQIDCGFTGGARFVLIKRTDSTGDWYVWDSARGIVAGNDSYLLLNSTAAEVTNTDYVDTYSAGFEISSTAPAAINANGGSFIFLAVA